MGKPHHNLEVWKRSLNFVTKIYKITANFPADEKFGLISQMRRAAVSIPSNISEGAARNSKKEFINFLHISQGSTAELETQIFISRNLNFLKSNQAEPLLQELEEISRMIIGLQKSLRRSK